MLARMQFSGIWRDYQARVLEELGGHFADGQIHVVAAPGSGKTVLGLEIVRRMARPALVLAPTVTIRDQWLTRLVPLFLQAAPDQPEVSRELAEPASLTVSTYQALHACWASEPVGESQPSRFEALIADLKRIGPITLVLDEAHHLRREWWNALIALSEALPEARLVALTATPPYDAPLTEWTRYEALCGAIDVEISVPELVRNGDLCPHQDHVILSAPEAETLALLDRRREAVAGILADLRGDLALVDFLTTHPWLIEPELHIEAILEAPQLLSAVLIFLAGCGRDLPSAPLRLLGVNRRELPLPSLFWTETLLGGLLFTHSVDFPIGLERSKWLRSALAEQGLIEGGRVKLGESRALFRLMASSLGKLESIAEIACHESANLGRELRLVVLSDHIREADLAASANADFQPAKLGVVPIFAQLRAALPPDQRLGVLTGKLVIVPASLRSSLGEKAESIGIPAEAVALIAVPGDPAYLLLSLSGDQAHRTVELITALFSAGEITVLVGTQALLGEGWDAPSINSLVLASNSAAFMLSNQMRGRALRIDPARPEKVANIWHLATVAPANADPLNLIAERLDWGKLGAGDDGPVSEIGLLERRFRAFEGIANGPSTLIESGLARLGLQLETGIAEANRRSLAIASDRAAIATGWIRSLGDAPLRAHVRETASPTYLPQRLSLRDTLRWLAASASTSAIVAMANEARQFDGWTAPATLAMALAGAGALAALPKLAKAGWLALRNGSLENCLTAVGCAVLHGLRGAGTISEVDVENASFESRTNIAGEVDLVLRNVSRATERAVMQTVAELLGPVQNPRYLLIRKSWLGLYRRTDWHAVPVAIARNAKGREAFLKAWRAGIGASQMIPARTPQGRRELLRARARSFAAGFQRRVDRRSVWL